MIQLARSPEGIGRGKDARAAHTVWCDLQGAQERQIDLSAADHPEALRRAERGGSLAHRNSLLAGIDDVRVDLGLQRVGPDAEQPVLGLQLDVDARCDEVGRERRDADAEVHVHAVAELERLPQREGAHARNTHTHTRT